MKRIDKQLKQAAKEVRRGKLLAAEKLLRRALKSDPNNALGLRILGDVFHKRGQAEQAFPLLERSVRADPRDVEAHLSYADVAFVLGRLNDAARGYRAALDRQPRSPRATAGLGQVELRRGRPSQALTHLRAAGNEAGAEVQLSIAKALQAMGRSSEALHVVMELLGNDPAHEAWVFFVDCLRGQPSIDVNKRTVDLLVRALRNPRLDPKRLKFPVFAVFKAPDYWRDLSAWSKGTGGSDPTESVHPHAWFTHPLLFETLTRILVEDPQIELVLISLRRSVLRSVFDSDGPAAREAWLPLLCALAHQCFNNEFAYPIHPDDEPLVQRLRDAVSTDEEPPPGWIATLASWSLLGDLPNADDLESRSWPPPLAAIVQLQISDTKDEAARRAGLRQLTPISDGVSDAVRAHYEQSPYPRYTQLGVERTAAGLGPLLEQVLPGVVSATDAFPDAPELLVAGCGTGQSALHAAITHAHSTVLAVDLSLTSLAYASRMADVLGVENITFAQADIMGLGELDRRFDVVLSGGVLHHLEDPLAGWRVLTDLLRPRGLMRIALYSDTARQYLEIAREYIALEAIPKTPEGVRRLRGEVLAAGPDGPLWFLTWTGSDFYFTSGLRDLLFHPMEHRFTVPRIAASLEQLDLEFLGFDLPAGTRHQYRRFNGDDANGLSLEGWHDFEQANPKTFVGMYQFWVRARA